jgi:hypothetical protein
MVVAVAAGGGGGLVTVCSSVSELPLKLELPRYIAVIVRVPVPPGV